jgi:hypothetical protein
MSQDPWDDWSDAWQTSATQPAADLDEIERRIRRRVTWRNVQIVIDLVACAMATAASLYSLSLGGMLRTTIGAAGLAFSLFGFFIALGGRSRRVTADRSVVAALDREILEIGADVRRSLGGLAIAGAGLLFLAVCTMMFATVDALSPARRWYALTGVGVIAGSALWSGWLLLRRKARLRRLTALRDELAG